MLFVMLMPGAARADMVAVPVQVPANDAGIVTPVADAVCVAAVVALAELPTWARFPGWARAPRAPDVTGLSGGRGRNDIDGAS
jgi:hypothetical protein